MERFFIFRSMMNCNDWILYELECLVQPHNSMSYAHVGLSIVLYVMSLLGMEYNLKIFGDKNSNLLSKNYSIYISWVTEASNWRYKKSTKT